MKNIKITCIFLSLVLFGSVCLANVNAEKEEDANQLNKEIDFTTNQQVFTAVDENGNVSFYTGKDVSESSTQENGYDIVTTNEDGDEEILENVASLDEAFDELEQQKENVDDVQNLEIKEADNNLSLRRTRSTREQPFVVKLKEKYTSDGNSDYARAININTNQTSGISWVSSRDAAYIRTEGDYYIVKIANMTAKVLKSDADLIPYNSDTKLCYYSVSNGKLNHYITTNMSTYSSVLQVGYQPSYLKANVTYYSYDGKYFYTDYQTMINDYRNNVYTNSVNKETPYYNYFQYLSHRTKSNYTGAQIDEYVNSVLTKYGYSNSKLKGMGQYFVNHQNSYGAHALLMLGVAINESGWGTSKIAQNKNNLFGHGAVDSNPYYGANGYDTPADGIKYHATSFVGGYSNIADWRYNGSLLGTKASGMNVKYATDQYWGEKAANHAYNLENYFGNRGIDYGKYNIGIVKDGASTVYKEANRGSTALYTTGNDAHKVYENSVVVLGTVSGESINGNNTWYKIASDTPLKSDRNSVNSTNKTTATDYTADRDYVYIHSSKVNLIDIPNKGFSHLGLINKNGNVSGFKLNMKVEEAIKILSEFPDGSLVDFKNVKGQSISSGVLATGMTFSISVGGVTTKYSVVIRGDTNGDGSILTNDYFIIKKYKENSYSLTGAYLEAADIDKNDQILTNDYFMIKKYKEGQYNIAQ